MKRLRIGDRILRVRDEGEATPALLCIHGAGSSSVVWMELVRRAAGVRRIVAPDLPGHGQSDAWHADVDAITLYRDAVGTAAATLGLERAILVGHSMGGMVALACAAAWPERVAGLVMVASGARLPVSASLLQRAEREPAKLAGWLAKVGFSPSTPPEIAERWASLAFADSLNAQAPGALDQTAYVDFSAVNAFDGRALLAQVQCPTLVITGKDDRLASLDQAAEIVAGISGATLEVVANAGHMIVQEQPAAFWQILQKFLTEKIK